MDVTPQSIGYAMNRVQYKLMQTLKAKMQRIQKVWNLFPLGAKEAKSLKSFK